MLRSLFDTKKVTSTYKWHVLPSHSTFFFSLFFSRVFCRMSFLSDCRRFVFVPLGPF